MSAPISPAELDHIAQVVHSVRQAFRRTRQDWSVMHWILLHDWQKQSVRDLVANRIEYPHRRPSCTGHDPTNEAERREDLLIGAVIEALTIPLTPARERIDSVASIETSGPAPPGPPAPAHRFVSGPLTEFG